MKKLSLPAKIGAGILLGTSLLTVVSLSVSSSDDARWQKTIAVRKAFHGSPKGQEMRAERERVADTERRDASLAAAKWYWTEQFTEPERWHKTRAEIEEDRWVRHMRAIVTGFSVKGHTITVFTKLRESEITEARELCHDMGAFIWAHPYRERYGIEDILIAGEHHETLSTRTGLRGDVQ